MSPTLYSWIKDLGFPIAVAAFVLVRLDRSLRTLILQNAVLAQALGQHLGIAINLPSNGKKR